MLYERHIFQCMDKIFCVEFQRYPLKFPTKYLTHTLKAVYFIQLWQLRSLRTLIRACETVPCSARSPSAFEGSNCCCLVAGSKLPSAADIWLAEASGLMHLPRAATQAWRHLLWNIREPLSSNVTPSTWDHREINHKTRLSGWQLPQPGDISDVKFRPIMHTDDVP